MPMKAVNKLPSYGADLSQTSVSGFSSGGFMTTQLHVDFSNQFVGAGIVAGGTYYCAGSNSAAKTVEDYMKTAATVCMMMPNNDEPNAQFLDKKAQDFVAAGKIDSLDHLKNQKIYIFSGASDKIIKTTVVDQVKQFYQLAGVSDNNIKYIDYINAGHAFITNNDSNIACSLTECPFINDCYFSQAQEILRQIYSHRHYFIGGSEQVSEPIEIRELRFEGNQLILTKRDKNFLQKGCYVESIYERWSC